MSKRIVFLGIAATITVAALLMIFSGRQATHPQQSKATAMKLLQDARTEKDNGNYELARSYLQKALEKLPQESEVRTELENELGFRLPMAEANSQLQKHLGEGLDKSLAKMEKYLEEHPEQIREARTVDDFRRAADALDTALEVNARSQLTEIQLILETYHAETGSYPKDREELLGVLEGWSQSLPFFDLVSYESSAMSFTAVFRNKKDGRELTLRPRGRP